MPKEEEILDAVVFCGVEVARSRDDIRLRKRMTVSKGSGFVASFFLIGMQRIICLQGTAQRAEHQARLYHPMEGPAGLLCLLLVLLDLLLAHL